MNTASASFPLQCQCGSLRGEVARGFPLNRGICYCKDCQAFAHFLADADTVLNAQGGSDIVQTAPQAVSFTNGVGNLRCVRLRENGLLRWYANCCSTPIGNTPASYKISFVGLIHSCLHDASTSTQTLDVIAPIRMHVHTASAVGEPKPKQQLTIAGIVGLGGMILRARLSGRYRQTPFFDTQGKAKVVPKVLNEDERKAVFAKLR